MRSWSKGHRQITNAGVIFGHKYLLTIIQLQSIQHIFQGTLLNKCTLQFINHCLRQWGTLTEEMLWTSLQQWLMPLDCQEDCHYHVYKKAPSFFPWCAPTHTLGWRRPQTPCLNPLNSHILRRKQWRRCKDTDM